MKHKTLKLSAIAAAIVGMTLAACGSGGELITVTQGTVIQNTTVVNTRDGSLASGMAVIIDGGKVQKITSANVVAGGTAVTVDGTGKFVVPGFLDMHTHANPTVDKTPSDFPMLLAYGVTGVREMSGSAAAIVRMKQYNADVSAGLFDGPEVLMMPGDIFGGQAPTAPLAVQFVQQQKTNGADFIKVASGGRDAVLAILGEAKNQGLTVAGHLVPGISAQESSNAGWRAIEHLGSGWGLMLDCATDQAAIRASILNGDGAKPPFPATYTVSPRLVDGPLNAKFYQRVMDTYSDPLCQSLAQTFAKNGTWQVPTLIRLRMMNFSDAQVFRTDPNLAYVDKTRRALWEQLGSQYTTAVPAAATTTIQQYYGLYQRTTKLMKQNGVKMMTGSDLGGIWVIPGVGLHQEFRELATAGLSPLEILHMTTLNGAEFMGRESTMGSVDAGKNADLVLLDGDPIADVANLDKVAAVFLKGKYFSKTALEKM